jgi:hypothetical protein
MAEDRSWMYSGWDKGGKYTDEWMDNATTFLDRAFSRTQIVQCPCSRHQNLKFLENKRTITIQLCKNGFVPSYEVWTFHGESGTRVIVEDEHNCDMGNVDRIDEMLDATQADVIKDPPTTEIEAFFKLVQSGGRSSTVELLTYFCYIFTLVGVVTFTICFSLQEKNKEEVIKKHGGDFNYEEEPIDGRVVYDSGGGKAYGR